MSNIYQDFGVTNGVTSSQEEHEQSMLEMDVAVRDGDDQIVLSSDEDEGVETAVSQEETEEVEQEDQADEEELDAEPEEDEESTEEDDSEEEEFNPLGDAPADVKEASEALAENESAFGDLVKDAVERGLPADAVERIKAEYSGDGISEESYAELEKAGYSRKFVDSYIKGQEALASQYVQGIVAYAGGADRFNSILEHLTATDKDAGQALIDAIQNRNLASVKAMINLAGKTLGKAHGVKPQRSVTTRGKPVVSRKAAQGVQPYSSQAEMIKDMSDSRYRLDAKFRQQVEQRVALTDF